MTYHRTHSATKNRTINTSFLYVSVIFLNSITVSLSARRLCFGTLASTRILCLQHDRNNKNTVFESVEAVYADKYRKHQQNKDPIVVDSRPPSKDRKL
jgi:hypothetical protein